MPAKSKSQRRLFYLAYLYKKGKIKSSEVSDKIKKLSKLPEKTLRDFIKTKESNLPEKIKEMLNLNPNMNVQSMGNVELPQGNSLGSGDLMVYNNQYEDDDIDDNDDILDYFSFKKNKTS